MFINLPPKVYYFVCKLRELKFCTQSTIDKIYHKKQYIEPDMINCDVSMLVTLKLIFKPLFESLALKRSRNSFWRKKKRLAPLFLAKNSLKLLIVSATRKGLSLISLIFWVQSMTCIFLGKDTNFQKKIFCCLGVMLQKPRRELKKFP